MMEIEVTDDLIERSSKRAVCVKCSRPQRVCWCPWLPEIPVRINGKVIILQHPGEEKRCLRTAPMLEHGLDRGCCLTFYGKKFPTARHIGLSDLLNEPGTLLLYPGRKAQSLADVLRYRDKAQRYNVVVLDGTWAQAKSMYYHSTILHSLTQVYLPEIGPSLYVVRTQPSENCLSTVESAALAVSLLENDSQIIDQLVSPLKALCTFQLKHGAVEHHDKVTLLELGQYTKKVGKRTIKFLKQTCIKSHVSELVSQEGQTNN